MIYFSNSTDLGFVSIVFFPIPQNVLIRNLKFFSRLKFKGNQDIPFKFDSILKLFYLLED